MPAWIAYPLKKQGLAALTFRDAGGDERSREGDRPSLMGPAELAAGPWSA